ncbi:MAG: hypothetical protein ACOYJD_05300 [Christensenellales bacterium]|jgi:hypothetical protein
MSKKKKRNNKYAASDDHFLDANVVTSSTECTGLIPALPMTEGESESYSELYGIPHQEIDRKE